MRLPSICRLKIKNHVFVLSFSFCLMLCGISHSAYAQSKGQAVTLSKTQAKKQRSKGRSKEGSAKSSVKSQAQPKAKPKAKPKARARKKRPKYSARKAALEVKTFQCSVTLKHIEVAKERLDGSRWDKIEEEDPDILVRLYGGHKAHLRTWNLESDQYKGDLEGTATWSPCSRYTPMMIVVYDRDEDDQLEVIGELPFRIDLLLRIPEIGETKSAQLRLAGGAVQALDVMASITHVTPSSQGKSER